MVPPVLWRGAEPVFYRLHADASVDLADLAAKIDGATRAVMVTHYFGFHQDVKRVRALCDARGVQLLEDCAHCFIGEYEGRPVGSYGDYAIASSMKFFPIYEGGVLASARHDLAGVALRTAGAGFEAKIALTSLENGFVYGRLPALHAALWLPLRLKSFAWSLVKARRAAGAPGSLAPDSSDSSFNLDPNWIDKRSSWFARAMLRLVSARRIAAQRRAHYQRLDEALARMPGVRPLFARLPEGVCPWVYPLVASDPEGLFARLQAAGVPVVRFGQPLWEGVDERVCANSVALARSVLSLPCHQELRADELDWLIDSARRALTA
jgi:dTDP-4-amino-4,6-dideoxygalactose transaminase